MVKFDLENIKFTNKIIRENIRRSQGTNYTNICLVPMSYGWEYVYCICSHAWRTYIKYNIHNAYVNIWECVFVYVGVKSESLERDKASWSSSLTSLSIHHLDLFCFHDPSEVRSGVSKLSFAHFPMLVLLILRPMSHLTHKRTHPRTRAHSNSGKRNVSYHEGQVMPWRKKSGRYWTKRKCRK